MWIAYREAAAVDPKAAANLVAAHRRRRETVGTMMRMVPEPRLRQPYERSADTMWAIGSIDVFLLQRTALEWDATQYAQWSTFIGGPAVLAAQTGGSVDVGFMAETPLVFAARSSAATDTSRSTSPSTSRGHASSGVALSTGSAVASSGSSASR